MRKFLLICNFVFLLLVTCVFADDLNSLNEKDFEASNEFQQSHKKADDLLSVYVTIVGRQFQKNWRYPIFSEDSHLQASVDVTIDANGRIQSAALTKSSGSNHFDKSVIRAIEETESVQKPLNNEGLTLRIVFNNKELSE